MEIIKSLHAGILYRTFSFKGQHKLAVSLLWGFKLDTGEPVLEQDLWKTLTSALDHNDILDACMPKSQAEFLAFGNCFAPQGEPVKQLVARIKVGQVEKSINVFGNRYWRRAMAGLGMSYSQTAPEPFIEMPVGYRKAFGGEDFPANMAGIGSAPVQDDPLYGWPLPNLESIRTPIVSSKDRPPPASFSRIDVRWQPRSQRTGTYDDNYLRNRMPGLPDDIDWRFFNEAAEDQWLPGYLKGDEAIEIDYMHPDLVRMKGTLPGVKGRCFINQLVQDNLVFKEAQTNLDTLLLFPNLGIGVVVHRGTFDVAEDDGSDVKQVLLAHEYLNDTPRSVDHYKNELKLRKDPEEGFKYLMYSAPLIPEGVPCAYQASDLDHNDANSSAMSDNFSRYSDKQSKDAKKLVDEKLAEVEARKNEILTKLEASGIDKEALESMLKKFDDLKQGGDSSIEPSAEAVMIKAAVEAILPGVFDKEAKFSLDKINFKAMAELPDKLKKVADDIQQREFARAKQKVEETANREEVKKLREGKLDLGTGPEGLSEAMDKAAKVFDFDELLKRLDPVKESSPAELPRLNLEETFADVHQRIAEAQTKISQMQQHLKNLTLPDQLGDTAQESSTEKFAQQIEELVPKLKDMESQTKAAGDRFREGYGMGAHFMPTAQSPHPGKEPEILNDFLQAYQAGESTADKDYAFVDFSNQDLQGVDFSNCYLEYANFTNTNLRGAKLNGAIAAKAVFNGTDLTGAQINNANLGATQINNSCFDETDFTGTTFGLADVSQSSFKHCLFGGRDELFLQSKFSNCDFSHAALEAVYFLDVEIEQCLFTHAKLPSACFINMELTGCQFVEADLSRTVFVAVTAPGLNFTNAIMPKACFISGVNLAGANFTGAEISEGNFRECNLQGACFSESQLPKADLSGANLVGANLEKVFARQAQFVKTDLSGSNCYRADMMEASLMKARLVGADFTEANLYSVSFLNSTLGNTKFTDAQMENTLLKDWRPL